MGCLRVRLIAALTLLPPLLHASRLPIRTYTTADGLARDNVRCVVQDSHGFLWFCTVEGLSRFDGYRFTNYHTAEGLPGDAVMDFLETRHGAYWVATTNGLARFDPAFTSASRFHAYPLRAASKDAKPYVLREDGGGGIWCGTNHGVFYLGPKDATFRRVELPVSDCNTTALMVDRRGALWIGTPDGLYRRDSSGDTKTYTTADGLPAAYIMALEEDREGQLWIGTRVGLVRMNVSSGGQQAGRMRVYTMKDGLPALRIESLLRSSNGKLWVGTNEGLAEWNPAPPPDGREFQSYTVAQGLSARAVGKLAEDRDGNLWMSTFGSGAMKMARRGFSTYTEADGVFAVASVLESRVGEVCALSRTEHSLSIARFDGNGFTKIRPALPRRITYFGWGSGQPLLQDRTGEWWIATGQGLCRFPRSDGVAGLANTSPRAVYTKRDGLSGDNIFSLFEDSRGGIWIGTIGPDPEDGMARWDRNTGRVHAFSEADGLPVKPVPNGFAEDRAGDVWATLYHGGLARYRHGRFQVFASADGVPGTLGALFVDSAGRLWIGSTRGLIRVDDPEQERPRFVTYTQGLSSIDIQAITEDGWGRLYAATGRGIDRFEPQPGGLGRSQHYATSDGIAAGELGLAFRDRQGSLWFSTPLGLSRLVPSLDRPRAPPPVVVTGVSVGGIPHPLSELGQSTVNGLKLAQSPLRIDYIGLGFSPGETLRYQYMLEAVDRDWSAPTDQRTVIYASLAGGSYRFLVRALSGDGTASPEAASVAFTILPPVWRTWWFLLLCGTVAALLIYAMHRYRLAQLLAVANLRTRIATDLHDDIGASLSQIAVLSEVAKGHWARNETPNGTSLSDIAGISRELVDSMSDIVWAINPEHDRLSNLVYRIRRFAADLLGGQGIALRFRSSVSDRDLKIGANVRRQIYLIFKEAIHNIVRHAGASRVEIDLDRLGESVVLRLSDNGKGFAASAESDGQGVNSIRKRTAALGGKVEWRSAPGQGTTLLVTVPLEEPRRLSVLRGRIGGSFR